MPKPLAKWSSARDAWETSQVSICGHSAVFSETWPTSGMTHSGTAYALPTSARLTDDSASSSLLPTPTTVDQSGSTPGTLRVEQGHQVDLRSAVIDLLHTPAARDWKGPSQYPGGLPRQVENLMPTPSTSDRHGGQHPDLREGHHLMLADAVVPLLPTPMAMIEDSKSPEHRQSYGHGSYFSDLPHLLGLVDGSPEHSAQPSEPSATELLPTPTAEQYGSNQSASEGSAVRPSLSQMFDPQANPSRSSRRAKRASTSESMPDLFSDGSYC